MATGTTFAAVTEKRLFGTADFRDRLLGHLRSIVQESYEKSFRGGCVYDSSLNLVSGGNDAVTVSGTSLATDGQGHLLDVATSGYATGLQFQNTAAVDYEVGLHYAEVPSGVQINPRTGLPEFVGWDETIGESGTPDLVTDNGNGTVTFRVNSVTESGVSNAGRKVRVWKNIPGPNATTEAVAIEELTVAWTGSNNEITTAAEFGQDVASTTAADYTVVLMGPTVKRNTTLYDVDGYAFLGVVTGGGSGAPPSGFDVTDQDVIDMSLSDLADITSRNATSDRLKIDVKSYSGDVNDPQIQVRDPSGTPVFTVDGNGNVVIEGTTTQEDFVQVNASETITDNLTAGDDDATDSHKIKGDWWHTNNAEGAYHFYIDGATGRVGIGKQHDTTGTWPVDIQPATRINNKLRLSAANVDLEFRETSEAVDAGGLWRFDLNAGDLALRENTAVAGDWSSSSIWFKSDRANTALEIYKHLWPSADDALDLGASAQQWRNAYVDGVAYIDTLSLSTTAGEGVATSIVPTAHASANLGADTYRWTQVYGVIGDFNRSSDTTSAYPLVVKHICSGTAVTYEVGRFHANATVSSPNGFGGHFSLYLGSNEVGRVQWIRDDANDQADLAFVLNDAGNNLTQQLRLHWDNYIEARTVLPFATDTYDLGSPSYRWANIYTANLNVGEDINPAADLTYDLGQPSVRWLNTYTRNVIGGVGGGSDYVNIDGPDRVNINGPLYLGGYDYAEPSGTMAGAGHTFLSQGGNGAFLIGIENGEGRVNLTWNAYFDGTTWRGWKGGGEGATRMQITENANNIEWTWWIDNSITNAGDVANVRSTDQKAFMIKTDGIWSYDKVIVESTEPRIHFVDSDLAVDAGGLWRFRVISGDFSLEENTAALGNFTSISGWFRTDRANAAVEFYKHVWPSADDTLDLGTSTQQWRNLHVDGTAYIDTLSLDITDGLGVATTMKPSADGTLDLGSSNRRWDTVYAEVLRTEQATPQVVYRETDVAVNAGGLWRFDLEAGVLTLRENTAAAGDWSTSIIYWKTDRTNSALRMHRQVWPSADNLYDLGSASFEWRNLYIDGTAYIDTLSLDTTDGLGFASHLKPAADNTYDLGGVNRYWRNAYIAGVVTLLSDTTLEETLVIRNTGTANGGSYIKFWSNEGDLSNPSDTGDVLGGFRFYGDAGDGVNSYIGASFRAEARSGFTATSAEGEFIWAVTASGQTAIVDRMALNSVTLYPLTTVSLGSATNQWENLYIDGTAYIDTLSLSSAAGEGVDTDLVPTTSATKELGSVTKVWQKLYISQGAGNGIGNYLMPVTDNAQDIGSNSYQWRHLYIHGTANIDTLSLSTAAGEGLASSVVPTTHASFNLGASSYRWGTVYSVIGDFYRSTDTLATNVLTVTHYVPSGGANRANILDLVATAGASNVDGFGGFVSFYNGANEVGRLDWQRDGANDQAVLAFRMNSVGDNMVQQLAIHYNNYIQSYHHHPFADAAWNLGSEALRWSDVFTARVQLIQNQPRLEFDETDVADDAGGLWRITTSAGNMFFQENTAAAGDWTSTRTWFLFNRADNRIVCGSGVVPSTDNSTYLGTSTLRWSTGWFQQLNIQSTTPYLKIRDENATVTDGGLWALRITGNDFVLTENLAAGGDFSSQKYWIFAARDENRLECGADSFSPRVNLTYDLGTTTYAWDWVYARNFKSPDYTFIESTDGHTYIEGYEAVPLSGSLAGAHNMSMVGSAGNWTTSVQNGAGRVNLSWNAYYDGAWKYWDGNGTSSDGATRCNVSAAGDGSMSWVFWFADARASAGGDACTFDTDAAFQINSAGVISKHVYPEAADTYDVGASASYFNNLYANTHYVDANFRLFMNGSTPRMTWDSADWIQYDRTNNGWLFGINDVSTLQIGGDANYPALLNVGADGSAGTTDLRGSHIHSYTDSNLSSVSGTRRRLVSIGGATNNEDYLTISQIRVSTGVLWTEAAFRLSREVDNAVDVGPYLEFRSTEIRCDGAFRPEADLTYELGGSSYRWGTIYGGLVIAERESTGLANTAFIARHDGLTNTTGMHLVARMDADLTGTPADGFGGYIRYETDQTTKVQFNWVQDGANTSQVDAYWSSRNGTTSQIERMRLHWDDQISLYGKIAIDTPVGKDLSIDADRTVTSGTAVTDHTNLNLIHSTGSPTADQFGATLNLSLQNLIGCVLQWKLRDVTDKRKQSFAVRVWDGTSAWTERMVWDWNTKIYCTADLQPAAGEDGNWDCGSSADRWANGYFDKLNLTTSAGEGVNTYLMPTNQLKDQGNTSYFWDYTYTDRLYTRQGNNYTFDNYDDLALIDQYNPTGEVVEVTKAGEVRLVQRANKGTMPWPMLAMRDPMAQSFFIDVNDSFAFILGAIKQLHAKHKTEIAELKAKVARISNVEEKLALLTRKVEALTA